MNTPNAINKTNTEAAVMSTGSIRFIALAVFVLFLGALISKTQAQESLPLLKKYDLGASRYSEGLDFYDGFLWHTSSGSLYKLDTDNAVDIDSDGDYDLPAEKTWNFIHHQHSESSVWFNDEIYNFTFTGNGSGSNDDIYKLELYNNETYDWEHVGDGLGTTNWGSCRDNRYPFQFIIYTGHYDNLLMWFNPNTGITSRTLVIPGLDQIEDIGMDRYGTVWASSFHSSYPGFYRIDPDTGAILKTFDGPGGLGIIDGIAVRDVGSHDVMFVTGKSTRYIWEYRLPKKKIPIRLDDSSVPEAFVLFPNYPNPFDSTTVVSFRLASDAKVNLSVFNVLGQKVRTLINGKRSSGMNSALWDGMNDSGEPVRSGLYLFEITVKTADREFTETITGILVK